jgi:hypothetical protein
MGVEAIPAPNILMQCRDGQDKGLIQETRLKL